MNNRETATESEEYFISEMKTELPHPINPVSVLIAGTALFVALFLTGCATMTQEDRQPVNFDSDPRGAAVAINGIHRGVTPCTINVQLTREKQIVEVSKDGYKTVTAPLKKSASGKMWSNALLGGFGVIGAAIDASTGKGSNYQDGVFVKLEPLPGYIPKPKPTTDSPARRTQIPSSSEMRTAPPADTTPAADRETAPLPGASARSNSVAPAADAAPAAVRPPSVPDGGAPAASSQPLPEAAAPLNQELSAEANAKWREAVADARPESWRSFVEAYPNDKRVSRARSHLFILDELQEDSPKRLLGQLDKAPGSRDQASIYEQLARWYLYHKKVGEGVLAASCAAVNYSDGFNSDALRSIMEEIRNIKRVYTRYKAIETIPSLAAKDGKPVEESRSVVVPVSAQFEIQDQEFVERIRLFLRSKLQIKKLADNKELPSFVWDDKAYIAATGLSVFPDPSDVPAMTAVMAQDPFEDTCVWMLRALVPAFPDSVFPLLDNPVPNVRANTAFALSVAEKDRALNALLALEKKETRDEVRLGIWETLAGFGLKDRVDNIAGLLASPLQRIRINALYAMQRMGQPVSLAQIQAAAEPTALWTKRAFVLVQLGQAFGAFCPKDIPIPDTALLRAAVSCLRQRPLDWSDLVWLEELLKKPADCYGVVGAFDGKDNKWRSSVNTAPWLDDEGFIIGNNEYPDYEQVRSEIAAVLAQRGRPYLTTLVEWTKGENPFLRRAATSALSAMTDDQRAKEALMGVAFGQAPTPTDAGQVAAVFSKWVDRIGSSLQQGFGQGRITLNRDGIQKTANAIGTDYVAQTRAGAVLGLIGKLQPDEFRRVLSLITTPGLAKSVMLACIQAGDRECLKDLPASSSGMPDVESRLAVAGVQGYYGINEGRETLRQALESSDAEQAKTAVLTLYLTGALGLDGEIMDLSERFRDNTFVAHLARWLLIRRLL